MKANNSFFILLAVGLIGIIGSTMPYLIFSPLFLHPTAGGLISTDWSIATRSLFLGIALATYPFGQFIGAPILGSLSDQIGRRKILVWSLLLTSICFILTAFSILYNLIWLLIVSRLLAGIFESTFALIQASIIDLPLNKSKSLAAISAMASIGYIFGPALGGILSDSNCIHWFNYALPFFVAGGLIFIASIGCRLWLPETLPSTQKRKLTFFSECNMVARFRNISKNKKLSYLLLSGFFICLAIDCYYQFYPALLVRKWHINPWQLSGYNIILSFALGIGSYFIPVILMRLQTAYQAIVTLLPILTISFILLLYVSYSFMLFPLFFLIGLAYGAISTFDSILISDHAQPNQQGEVMGVRWGLRTLGDAGNCIVGGILLAHSANLPIVAAVIFTIVGLSIYFVNQITFSEIPCKISN